MTRINTKPNQYEMQFVMFRVSHECAMRTAITNENSMVMGYSFDAYGKAHDCH